MMLCPICGYCCDALPPAVKHNIDQYAQHHVDPGDFLIAVLSNNLREAFGRADDVNRNAMFEIVRYCYNHIDARIWGSPDAVIYWLGQREEIQKPMDPRNGELLLPLQPMH
jgi:hypothetical protein